MLNFFATCPKGLENLLFNELKALDLPEVHETVAGVSFKGTFEAALRVCLCSRFASRVILILSVFHCEDDTDLYMGAAGVAWEDYFNSGVTMSVEFVGVNKQLRNTLYSAQKVKDGVCDRLLKAFAYRPRVERKQPEVRVYGYLHEDEARLGIDLSGEALLKREFHRRTGMAPLKENLAAAMVVRSGYSGENFLDPMCGSGTLLIEAALIATDTAPGLRRHHFGFLKLKLFDKAVFEALVEELKERSARGIAAFKEKGYKLVGFDSDPAIIRRATENVRHAGLEEVIAFEHRPLSELVNPFAESAGRVTVVTNPPYGERMGNFHELIGLYTQLGQKVRTLFKGATLAVISSSQDLLSCLRLSYEKSYKLFNGALPCQLRVYDIRDSGESQEEAIAPDFANRLLKNLKVRDKWAEREGYEAYRVYDADLPDYQAAIDRYGPYVVIQAYAAPESVPEHVARQRSMDLIAATLEVMEKPGSEIVIKERARKSGTLQYEKTDEDKSLHRTLTVREGRARFEVNIDDYLDTGLFLDSRPIRELIFKKAEGKSFLNLFAYTATASVMAALGGASRTVSVDMSRTYLDWGMRNFRLNEIALKQHAFIQADCLAWLSQEQGESFDLIYVDPPTFSNSKRMEKSFEVGRDQVALLSNLTRHLKDGGEIIFCTNKRRFKLDSEALKDYGLTAEDVSEKTIPEDFKRDPDIHSCFILTFDRSACVKEPAPIVTARATPRWSGRLNPENAFTRVEKKPRGTYAYRNQGTVSEGETWYRDSYRRRRTAGEQGTPEPRKSPFEAAGRVQGESSQGRGRIWGQTGESFHSAVKSKADIPSQDRTWGGEERDYAAPVERRPRRSQEEIRNVRPYKAGEARGRDALPEGVVLGELGRPVSRPGRKGEGFKGRNRDGAPYGGNRGFRDEGDFSDGERKARQGRPFKEKRAKDGEETGKRKPRVWGPDGVKDL